MEEWKERMETEWKQGDEMRVRYEKGERKVDAKEKKSETRQYEWSRVERRYAFVCADVCSCDASMLT
ncbi:unnamed protein product [Allacma fusca]|uniref:Uncharacterized protein n=1 Tax=Allacma fusca TaxID=39272 RepID=A0A8J2LV78_9HEXA|nr:unnamed protein product [Allacma fusca]